MNAQIVIMKKALENEKNICWGFTKSKTGQIDFVGEVEQKIDDYQEIASDGFNCNEYTYLTKNQICKLNVYIAPDCEIDKNLFGFITRIGVLLLAVETGDTNLASLVLFENRNIYQKFLPIVLYIVEPIIVPIFFSMKYTMFEDLTICDKKESSSDLINAITDRVKQIIDYNNQETIEQAMIRYIASQEKFEVTLPVVGISHHRWFEQAFIDDDYMFSTMLMTEGVDKFKNKVANYRQTKQALYDNLEVKVQAEPYNSYDENAISVSIDSVQSCFGSYDSLVDAGFVRKLAAAIIRKAKPHRLSFKASLHSLCSEVVIIKIQF